MHDLVTFILLKAIQYGGVLLLVAALIVGVIEIAGFVSWVENILA